MRVSKILSFSAVILLITVVFAGAVTVPAAAQYDTMQFHYNAQHTGDYSPVAGLVPSNGQLKWNYTTDDGVVSSPAIVNGVVYVGSFDNNLYALYANNGTKLWNYPTGSVVRSSPAVANGVVYVGSNDFNVYALNAATGAKVWNYTTDGAVLSSPAIANGVVYVGSGFNYNTGIWDNNLYAINANNGTKLWNYTTGDEVYSSPAVANGVVYVGSDDGNVYALGTIPTTLTAYAPAQATVNTNFPIIGRLTVRGYGISSQNVTLYSWNGTAWLSTGKNATTDAIGVYSFSRNETAIGNYSYRTTYAGSATYANATSATFNVTVTRIPTVLTATARAKATVNNAFTVHGTLTMNPTRTGIGNATVTLLKYNATSKQYDITLATTTTNSTAGALGAYTFSVKETNAGTYYYEVTYAGTATYQPKTSAPVKVIVR